MDHVKFSLKRLLTVTQDNKKDLTMLLTGIKMVSEKQASKISINTDTITADVTRDYSTNFVTIKTPYYGLMFNCNDSGALAYYGLAVLSDENSEVSMSDLVDMFSTKAMYFKQATEKDINIGSFNYMKEMQSRLHCFVMLKQFSNN